MARKGNRGEMYKDLFSGVSITTVSIPLLAEELKQAKELTQANKWSEEEGLQIIFANGLSYLLGEARLTALNGSDVLLAEELKKVTDALMDMQSKYAVMKFRAYTLDEAKQGLQMNVTGLELENRMSASRL